MFKSDKPKSAFLQKRSEEKAKAADQVKRERKVKKLQKHIRAFLCRRIIESHFSQQQKIKLSILMRHPLDGYQGQQIQQFVQILSGEKEPTKMYFLEEFILQNAGVQNCREVIGKLLDDEKNQLLRNRLIGRKQFVGTLQVLFRENRGLAYLNASCGQLKKSGLLKKIDPESYLELLFFKVRKNKMDIQDEVQLTTQSSLTLVQTLFGLDHQMFRSSTNNIINLTLFFIQNIKENEVSEDTQKICCYLFEQILNSGKAAHEGITNRLMKENQHLVKLIEDVDMLEEIELKLRRSEELEEFGNWFLAQVRTVMTHKFILKLFQSGKYVTLNQSLLKMVNELSVLFEDRKLIFIRDIISSDSILTSLSKSKDPMFMQGLKMRLLAMDDPQFKQFSLFSMEQWNYIIGNCVDIADENIRKMGEKDSGGKEEEREELVPFRLRNRDEIQFKTVVSLMTNLYKKVLRTNKFKPEVFISQKLSDQLQNFLFGKGAVRIEHFLKQLPFLFSFQSRIEKFKEFIKTDKANHDRNMFIHQDLVITVRRGSQFMDAYQACMTRDMRKNHKIIFYNQLGHEQQGIDVGGIIKEFINRVLKSAFSEIYSLFMDTPHNEMIPNPYSNETSEYQFIGKLVGKAVYQDINIEQKFAEPFLNLLIGRQNTFQDLQFIDPDIYRNLIALKNSQEDISVMEQTFTIYDTLPNGQHKFIDLLCPSKPPSNKQVMVNNQNKMDFIMAYADFKCNKQIEEKTRLFRRGFLKVIRPEWLTMFSNQELNSIISGSNPDFDVDEMKSYTILRGYTQKDETVIDDMRIKIFTTFIRNIVFPSTNPRFRINEAKNVSNSYERCNSLTNSKYMYECAEFTQLQEQRVVEEEIIICDISKSWVRICLIVNNLISCYSKQYNINNIPELIKKYSIFYPSQIMEIKHNIFLKYEDYIKAYPFIKNIELKCKILAKEHLNDDRYDYFGDRVQTMRHGVYGIMLSIARNKVLSIYQGSWGSDTYHGKGILYTFSHPKSESKILRVMEGQWSNGVLHGRGFIKNYEKEIGKWVVSYEGEFQNGQKSGLGIERVEDTVYRGQFSKGCRTGNGRLQLDGGNFFDGQFNKGFLVGQSYESVGDTFIITDGSYSKKVYRKPQNMQQFTSNFSKLIHQISTLK